MATQLDVYRDWLGIPDTERPLTYYQLLRLPAFEDNPAKIRTHYRKMNGHVRKYAAGDFATQSQELLNELAKAMLCLTDKRRKAEYDASLGRKDEGSDRRYTLEQILLGRKLLDRDKLEQARSYAEAVGLEVRDAILQQKLASPETVMQAYAESLGIPYVELKDVGVNEELVPKIPVLVARKHSCAPLMLDEGLLLIASPNPLPPDVEDDLRLRTGHPVRSVLCTPGGINEVIAHYYPREAAAAEMARSAEKQSGVKATQTVETADGKVETTTRPLTPEEMAERKKQRNSMTIVGFNFTFMATVLTCNMALGMGLVQSLVLGLPAAATVAGIIFMVKK